MISFSLFGARDGAVVRALASHQCGPGSNSGVDAIFGLSLLLVLSFAPRVFSPGTPPVFRSPQKPTFPNSNSTRDQGPGTRDQGPGTRDQEPGTRNQESGIRNQESGIRNQESGIRNQESGIRNHEPRNHFVDVLPPNHYLFIYLLHLIFHQISIRWASWHNTGEVSIIRGF